MDYIFNKYYFKTLHKFKSIKVPNRTINNIKLLSNNKLLCLNERNVLIFNISNNKLVYSLIYNDNFINNEILDKIELVENDRFLLYNNNYVLFYKILEDKEKDTFDCLELGQYSIYPQKMEKYLIYSNKKIIYIKSNTICIFNISKDNSFEMQTRLNSELLNTENKYNLTVHIYPFILNSKILGYLRYLKLEFWDIKKCKYIYTSDDFEVNLFFCKPIIITMKDNILINNDFDKLIIFSFSNRAIIQIITDLPNIKGALFTFKFNLIFSIYENNIYILNSKKEKIYKLNRKEHEFGKYFLIADNGDFIVSSESEIIFLKTSVFKTIIFDVFYFFGTFLYHLLILRIYYGNKFTELSKIKYMILNYIPFLIYKKLKFPDYFEDTVIRKKKYWSFFWLFIFVSCLIISFLLVIHLLIYLFV